MYIANILTYVKVKDLMLRHAVVANINASVGTALKLMQNAKVSMLPIVAESKLVGILTKDQAEREPAKERIASLSLKLVYVKESDPVEKAAKLMVENALTRLPVVKEEMRFVGIITSTEIAKYHKEK